MTYGKLPKRRVPISNQIAKSLYSSHYEPTFDEASVRLLSVVLLPAEGFPTRPTRGSRGIAGLWRGCESWESLEHQPERRDDGAESLNGVTVLCGV